MHASAQWETDHLQQRGSPACERRQRSQRCRRLQKRRDPGRRLPKIRESGLREQQHSLLAHVRRTNLRTGQANGKDYSFTQVPGEIFSNFFEGAGEIAQMLAYFEAYSYMGPNSDKQMELAHEIATEEFTSLNEWIRNVIS